MKNAKFKNGKIEFPYLFRFAVFSKWQFQASLKFSFEETLTNFREAKIIYKRRK